MSTDLANIDDLAALFKTDKQTVMEWRRRYAWPHTRIGRKFFFTPEQVAEIKKRHAVDAPTAAPVTGQTARSAARRRAS